MSVSVEYRFFTANMSSVEAATAMKDSIWTLVNELHEERVDALNNARYKTSGREIKAITAQAASLAAILGRLARIRVVEGLPALPEKGDS